MKYLHKFVMLYSYYSYGKVESRILSDFFDSMGDASEDQEYSNAHSLVIDLKRKLEKRVDSKRQAIRKMEEALILYHDLREDPLKRDALLMLIKNLYYPKWSAEEIERFHRICFVLDYSSGFYFSYTNNSAPIVNSLFATIFPQIQGLVTSSPTKNALALFIKDFLSNGYYLSGYDVEASDRSRACVNSLIFVQLVHQHLFSDDNCFEDFKLAYESGRPHYFRYILVTEKDALPKLGSIPKPKREWYKHIIHETKNQAVAGNLEILTKILQEISLLSTKEGMLEFIQSHLGGISFAANSSFPTEEYKIILFASANPQKTQDLDTVAEFFNMLKELADALDSANQDRQTNYYILPVFQTKIADLRELMIKYDPDIVHFAGHGTRYDGLFFEDDQGKKDPIPVDSLGTFFQLAGPSIECVFLNACFSMGQAEAIKGAGSTSMVIGTTEQISDEAAKLFSKEFYQTLFNERGQQADYQRAFQIAQTAVNHLIDSPDMLQLLG